ncbi:hypothetical protein STA22820_01170 [Edwardsiella ictaluri]|nr:hypothetical protein KH20906_01170 [Edwardsiella ictaluri]BEI14744.1 hypothetical protein STA22820_01170 [Edwardsiella ictaluri]BEI18218.1 hypothetical protein STH22820_01180 [Edwardsiella ictaluri]
MPGGHHQTYFIIEQRRIVQRAARQNIRGQHQIQLPLLQRGLGIEGNAGAKIERHLGKQGLKLRQGWRQPLNTAVTLNGQTQRLLRRYLACL